MPDKAKKQKKNHPLIGPIAFLLFGLLVGGIGLNFVIHHEVLSRSAEYATAEVLKAGNSGTSKSNPYLWYRFTDPEGGTHYGYASGYRATTGSTVTVEYAPDYPFLHRMSGAGLRKQYRWRWAIFGFGVFFAFIGAHWLTLLLRRRSLITKLSQTGFPLEGTITRISHGGKVLDYGWRIGSKTYKGRTIVQLSPAQTQGLQAGDALDLLHDPANPSQAIPVIEIAAYTPS